MGLREELKNDHDKCFEQILNLLRDYVMENPGSQKHAEDCFHSNVKKEDLDKCHWISKQLNRFFSNKKFLS